MARIRGNRDSRVMVLMSGRKLIRNHCSNLRGDSLSWQDRHSKRSLFVPLPRPRSQLPVDLLQGPVEPGSNPSTKPVWWLRKVPPGELWTRHHQRAVTPHIQHRQEQQDDGDDGSGDDGSGVAFHITDRSTTPGQFEFDGNSFCFGVVGGRNIFGGSAHAVGRSLRSFFSSGAKN
jgi:hypothetical protein